MFRWDWHGQKPQNEGHHESSIHSASTYWGKPMKKVQNSFDDSHLRLKENILKETEKVISVILVQKRIKVNEHKL